MRVRAVIVDLFGTLVCKWPAAVSVARKRQMAEAAGLDERVFRDAWASRWLDRELGRVSLEGCIVEVLEGLEHPEARETASRLREVWIRPVREHLNLTMRPDALATLEKARREGLKIGLVSNAGPEVPEVYHATPLRDVVDEAVFSCTVGVAKPDPRIYLSVCNALAVSPKDCVYVGDGGDDELQGALEVGMTPLLLRVEREIAEESLPPGAASWTGPVIGSFNELWERMGVVEEVGW
jgi:putative hydrolase of the HAD superfamily